MKKFGYFVSCFLPLMAMIALQYIVMIPVFCVFAITKGIELAMQGETSAEIMASQITAEILDNLLIGVIGFQIIGVIIAIPVYYFFFKKKKFENPVKCISAQGVVSIVLLFAGFECFIGTLLTFASYVFPETMEKYAEMIEQSGLAEMSLISTIATVFLAPVLEEIVFRGITFKLARKFTAKFWIANIIQAAMFGIAHMNLVQGLYAFCMGLVLGVIYKKYNSIWATILGHLIFNISGTFLVNIVFGSEDPVPLTRNLIILVVSTVVMVIAFIIISKDKKTLEREAMFNECYALESITECAANNANTQPEVQITKENDEKDN